jgi:hypothetical protein
MKWLFLTPVSLLVPAVILLQVEVHNLGLEVAKAGWESGNAALAVEKFERDFFAKMERSAPRRTFDDGMKKLPADNFRGPVSWPSPTPQSEPSAKR